MIRIRRTSETKEGNAPAMVIAYLSDGEQHVMLEFSSLRTAVGFSR